MKFNSLIPELSVTNIEKSKKFYLNLGFKIMYERKEDKFWFLYLEDNQIMIEEINNNWSVGEIKYPFGNGINISMAVSDIDSFYESIINIKIDIICLIKPQFECGKEIADKYKEIILNEDIHISIINSLIEYFNSKKFYIKNLTSSPIRGGDGNIEYLAYISNKINQNARIDINKLVLTSFKEKMI